MKIVATSALTTGHCRVLGMVPGVRDWRAAFEHRRRRSLGYGDDRFNAVLRLASGACIRIEIAQAVMVGHWAGVFQHLLAAVLFGV
jgi:hypothetical protein